MTKYDQHTDLPLFRAIAEGDEIAYTEVFHLYTPRLFPYILKIVKEEALAREFVQETFLRLWIHRAELHDVQLPGSWLFRIAANLCMMHLRSLATRRGLQQRVYESMAPGAFPVQEVVEHRDLQRLIQKAVDALPEKRRQVYLLSREAGLTHQQIADQMGISVHTVKNQLGTALRSIQDQLHQSTGLSMALIVLILQG